MGGQSIESSERLTALVAAVTSWTLVEQPVFSPAANMSEGLIADLTHMHFPLCVDRLVPFQSARLVEAFVAHVADMVSRACVGQLVVSQSIGQRKRLVAHIANMDSTT